ncbi:MAG: acyl-CoA dehydrogenase family protein, partial [Dehalococcoidia bacterium]
MDFTRSEEQQAIRAAIRDLCKDFPGDYWRETDVNRRYPTEFVNALTEAGWLAALIPEQYGGAGLGITEAAIILEEINHSGGMAAVAHAQMYVMGTLLKHGNEDQKQRYLPKIATGELRL